jgi:hypothetical protein
MVDVQEWPPERAAVFLSRVREPFQELTDWCLIRWRHTMRETIRGMAIILALSIGGVAQTPVEVQPVKELKPTGSLGTCGYTPTSQEKAFLEKLSPKEQATGSFMESYDIHKKNDVYVSWYGVVRGISKVVGTEDRWQLLLENKYFDGMTDCHIMLVSMSGSGDFLARLQVKELNIPALALVRVYGRAKNADDGTPVIDTVFIRVWPWMTFTFTDLGGEDKSNPRWRKECKLCKGRIYKPYPNERYYWDALGNPNDYGMALK